MKVLNDQVGCLTDLSSHLDRNKSALSDHDSREQEHWIIYECLASIRATMRQLSELEQQSAGLRAWVCATAVIVPYTYNNIHTRTFNANTSLSTITAKEPHRRQQRPARSRYPRLHHCNDNIPAPLVCLVHIRYEHFRHTQHRQSTMDLLGVRCPGYCCSDALVIVCNLQIRAAATRLEETSILGVWKWQGC